MAEEQQHGSEQASNEKRLDEWRRKAVDAKLEEYKSLRAEIPIRSSSRFAIMTVFYAGIFLLISDAVKEAPDNPHRLAILLAIPFLIVLEQTYAFKVETHVSHIGSYIRQSEIELNKVFDQKLPQGPTIEHSSAQKESANLRLGWESTFHQEWDKMRRKAILFNPAFPELGLLMLLSMACSIAGSYGLLHWLEDVLQQVGVPLRAHLMKGIIGLVLLIELGLLFRLGWLHWRLVNETQEKAAKER